MVNLSPWTLKCKNRNMKNIFIDLLFGETDNSFEFVCFEHNLCDKKHMFKAVF
jgi:hypothetical protein